MARRAKSSRRGRFIVLEGIDGSGTTTQATALVARIEESGHRAHLTWEPSGGPIGVLIRQILTGRLLGAEKKPIDGAAVALLFAADRIDHLWCEIEPLLAKGVHVVSDRYLTSSLAYQGEETDRSWVHAANRLARSADLTLFVDVPPAVAAARRATRPGRERFDDLAMQRRIARAYRKVLRETEGLGPIVTINGKRGRAQVAQDIWHAVQSILR